MNLMLFCGVEWQDLASSTLGINGHGASVLMTSCEKLKSRQFTAQRMHFVKFSQQNHHLFFMTLMPLLGVEWQDLTSSTFEINGNGAFLLCHFTTYM